MPNIALVLKHEIRRLARKEIKEYIEGTRRITARYRGDIAQLKRAIQLQQRRIAFLETQKSEAPSEAPSETVAPGSRFSSRSVRAQRKRLGLSADQYAQLVGVSAQTIYLWERGKVRPKASQFAALIAARGLSRRDAHARLDVASKKPAKRVKARPKKAKR